jgi:type IV pilus assembly protein PilN
VIQINLLPKEEQVREPRVSLSVPRGSVVLPMVGGALVLLPLFGLHAMQQARVASLRADVAQAQVEMQRLKPQIERIESLTREREELNTRLSIVQSLTRERYVPVTIMDQLADQVPDYLWLTHVGTTGSRQVTIEGLTFSNLMVAELMSRMESAELFDGVSLVVAEKAKGNQPGSRPVLSFTLTARVKS